MYDFYTENVKTSFRLLNTDEISYAFNPKYHVNKEYMEKYYDKQFINELLRNPELGKFICEIYQINNLDMKNELNNEKVFTLYRKNSNRCYS